METRTFDVLTMLHLIMLSMWGGVVATEAVMEVFPFRERELHAATPVRFPWAMTPSPFRCLCNSRI